MSDTGEKTSQGDDRESACPKDNCLLTKGEARVWYGAPFQAVLDPDHPPNKPLIGSAEFYVAQRAEKAKERRERIATEVLAGFARFYTVVVDRAPGEVIPDAAEFEAACIRARARCALVWADALIAELDKPTPQEAPHPADLKERFR